ncbi:hypothetical protein O7599_18350 [Streptomyces sp. WMMC500]|uniref:hypothetical protein n=1 Tax=Streptomyces sp. WMMC500 TaxID=3015154 RepID=UPI00248B8CAA|nr:hypothetical protein [Streptomyces sp. WMMC500]WBB64345.1 hypothetical protein O7599_18350 [Streptomyces sp. WMMC500]
MAGARADDAVMQTLARVCGELDNLRAAVASDEEAEFDRIVAELRQGDDGTRQRTRAALGALNELLRRSGVAGGLTAATRGAGVGGLPPLDGHPVLDVLVCPRDLCARAVSARSRAPEARTCRLYDEPLRGRTLS